MHHVSDAHASYGFLFMTEDDVLAAAANIMEKRVKLERKSIGVDKDVISLLQPRIGYLQYEMFSVIFLNTQNEVIDIKDMFRGTIDQTAVYPREIISEALKCNAKSIILTHNHPSGTTQPSEADKTVTTRIVEGCRLLDIRVLDHIIMSGNEYFSFATHGLI